MHARRLLAVAAAAFFAGCNCNPTTQPNDGGLACDGPETCPATNNECLERTCLGGVCGTRPLPADAIAATQTAGDCKRNLCDGTGNVTSVEDTSDVKSDDNDCTLDTCGASGAVHTNVDAGVHCGMGGALVCDGAGKCVGCNAPGDCGQDTACTTRTCTAGACGASFVAQGTATATQTAGDCQQNQCDGQGAIVTAALASDVPVDGNECTDDVCTGITPSNPPKSSGATCAADGGVLCDGAGACVACNQPSDCPGQDTFCRARSCTNHACGFTNTMAGTALPMQTARDCRRATCDGNGGTTSVADDVDLPVDNNPCTDDVCTMGAPSNPLRSSGASCGMNLVCDATGNCVGCRTAADCPGTSTECRTITCTSNVCGSSFASQGTPLAMQTGGDCRRAVCDGMGNSSEVNDDADVPVDNAECTDDVCASGVPSNPPRTSGATCSENGGTRCNGAGACVQCLMAAHCGANTECQAFACPAGACLTTRQDAGTPLAMQTAGNCQRAVCDGLGGTTAQDDDGDLPVDSNQCTGDVCTAGVPSNPALDAGTPCTQGGAVCNGASACVECVTAADCGASTECRTFTCTNGTCGSTFTPSGTTLIAQTSGDCRTAVCDGAGGVTTSVNDADLPVDNVECTADVCTGGTPSNPPLMANMTCSQGGGTRCDGMGACVQCLAASDCGANTACSTFTCTAGVCGATFAAAGTLVPGQTAGDCRDAVCDGAGSTTTSANDGDLPVDNVDCTADVCTSGVPSNPPRVAGYACAQNGGSRCDGAGQCVQCSLASECPGADTDCQTRTCSSGACGFTYANAGTLRSTQTAGDCRTAECDGAGGTTYSVNDADVPVDGLQCTDDVCTAGAPSNPPRALGATCSEGTGTKCDGAGVCVQCNVGADCGSGVCTSNVCQAPTCMDNVRNAAETDVDCGGGACPPCRPARACVGNSDCQTNLCTMSVCQSPGVASAAPANGATGVAVTAPIAITFTGAMTPATVTAQTSASTCTGAIQVSADDFVTCIALSAPVFSSGNTVATVTPASQLASATRYRIRVTTAAQDSFGNPLGATFTTPSGFLTATVGSSCGLVISQVYGGGGNSGAPWTNDFIELRNQGTTAVSLNGWAVQYASAAGTTWSRTNLPNVTLQPGAYFLVQEAGGANGSPLPTPDATGTIAMSATGGKVALTNTTTALSSGCPTGGAIVDFVGFGAANCSEGSGPTPAPSATTSVQRAGFGCAEANDNAHDFATGTPVPRNTASVSTSCSACGVQNETNNGTEADYCNVQFPTSFTVAPATVTQTLYGRIYEAGVTEPAGAPSNVLVQVGYGPSGVNPTLQCGWQFFAASYNVQVGNDDEFQGSFTAPAYPGAYWYTFRFSIDDGATWTYADIDGAGSNGGLSFDTAQLPVMTVQ